MSANKPVCINDNVFSSINEALDFYGVPLYTYHKRLQRGWNKERAMTTPVIKNRDKNTKSIVIEGIRYTSIKDACSKYGVHVKTYHSRRLEKGMSVEEAITTPFHNLKYDLSWENLSRIEQQVILGSLLGDGSLHWEGRNPYFSENHSLKQKDYVLWKANILQESFDVRTYQRENSIGLATRRNPIFQKLHQELYGFGKERVGTKRKCKGVPLSMIEKLDALGLLIWYLDDGTLVWKSPNISIDRVSREHYLKVLSKIKEVFNFDAKLNPKSRMVIAILKANHHCIIPKWQQLMKKLAIPDCMRYKVPSLK